jgi:uncharacterized protein
VVDPGLRPTPSRRQNNLNRLIIDDDLNNQNPDPILFGTGRERTDRQQHAARR